MKASCLKRCSIFSGRPALLPEKPSPKRRLCKSYEEQIFLISAEIVTGITLPQDAIFCVNRMQKARTSLNRAMSQRRTPCGDIIGPSRPLHISGNGRDGQRQGQDNGKYERKKLFHSAIRSLQEGKAREADACLPRMGFTAWRAVFGPRPARPPARNQPAPEPPHFTNLYILPVYFSFCGYIICHFLCIVKMIVPCQALISGRRPGRPAKSAPPGGSGRGAFLLFTGGGQGLRYFSSRRSPRRRPHARRRRHTFPDRCRSPAS